MRIVNNIAALNATNIKAKNTKALSKSIENLSSGLRINKAADDAAGLAISQKMRAQIRGLSQASRNAQDGISLIQTVEGAVGEMTDIAQRMRELCVQGANGTLTDEDRDKIQLELDSMKDELSSIANKTEFNTKKLLDGSQGMVQYNKTVKVDPNLTIPIDGNTVSQTLDFDGALIDVAFRDKLDGNIEIMVLHNGTPLSTVDFPIGVISAGQIEWSKTIGGSSEEIPWSIKQTSDGGYIIAGETYSTDGDVVGGDVSGDGWIVKLSDTGNIEWQQTLGGSLNDYSMDVVENNDGSFSVLSTSFSNDGDFNANNGERDIWLTKLNSDGSIAFSKNYGGTDADNSFSMIKIADGSIVFTGWTTSNDGDISGNHGSTDAWVAKIDTNGNLLWQKPIGGAGFEMSYNLSATSDGGFIIVGDTDSSDGDFLVNRGLSDAFAVKMNNLGNIEWSKTYGGTDEDKFYGIKQTPDGGYIMTGSTRSNDIDVTVNQGNSDLWIVKTDSSGVLEWQKSYGGTMSETSVNRIEIADDGSYFVMAVTTSNDGDVSSNNGLHDMWQLNIDAFGNLISEQTFGGSSNDFNFNNGIMLTTDGGLVTAAVSASSDGDVPSNQGGGDIWIIKQENLKSLNPQKIDLFPTGFNFNGIDYSFDNASVTFSNIDLRFINTIEIRINGGTINNSGINLQIGANTGQTMTIAIDDMRPEALGFINGMPRVNPIEMAGVSITLTDQAIMRISSQRSTLGAYQNRLEHVIRNLDNSAENLQAAESRITDLDMAKGVSEMTKFNILSQAADAMIAQANQQPQGILQLLK